MDRGKMGGRSKKQGKTFYFSPSCFSYCPCFLTFSKSFAVSSAGTHPPMVQMWPDAGPCFPRFPVFPTACRWASTLPEYSKVNDVALTEEPVRSNIFELFDDLTIGGACSSVLPCFPRFAAVAGGTLVDKTAADISKHQAPNMTSVYIFVCFFSKVFM